MSKEKHDSEEEKYVKDPTTIIKKCDCKHGFQDKRYGEGLRVHNLTGKKGSCIGKLSRCTVCGKETTK